MTHKYITQSAVFGSWNNPMLWAVLAIDERQLRIGMKGEYELQTLL